MTDPVTVGAAVGWGISAVGWVVSPSITRLLNRGFSYLGIDGAEKLKELETKVLHLELLIEAVEESPHRNRLEKLLQNLRSAFYQAEDILDDVEYYRLEKLVLSQSDSTSVSSSSRNWVKKLHSSLSKSSHLIKGQVSSTTSDVPPPSMPKSKLKKILKKIESIVNEAHKILQLLNLPGCQNFDRRQTVTANSRGMVTTAAPPHVVIGRDEDCKKVTDMLRETVDDGQPECSSALRYSIIGIYGIPGSGKSTIAQYVFAHEKNSAHFDVVMWVHVSQTFSVNTILRLMIEQITDKPSPSFDGTTALQKYLEEVLHQKRFLLVLDDVWYNKNQENLWQLMCPLNAGKAGSKILATSRTSDALLSLGAVTALHAVRCIHIRDLDDDVFFKLFMHYAFDVANIDERDKRKFEMIGSEIASKLKRSPLAARMVGGQLYMRPDFEIWRNALDQDLLNDTMGALWWSYQQLNEQIRRCFTYCSIFPRMYQLGRDELVNLWVAEGFITTNPGEEMEDVAQSYINELVSTSFLQPLGGGKERYMIHDLLHDLVEKAAGSDCFRVGCGWEGEFSPFIRHLFIETCTSAMVTKKIVKLKNLRTLIFYTDENDTAIQEKAFEDVFRSLRALRVLCIRPWRTETFIFPPSIGQLKHLRYLSFQMNGQPTKIILPRTFCKLYHMQHLHCDTIVFSSCEDIVKLINLRHLSCLRSMDFPNIGRLMSLRTFGSFWVKKEPGYELHQLKDLNKLQGSLGIHGLENVGSREEAVEANLAAKKRLSHLILGWDSDNGLQICSAVLQADILEGLCPPVYLDILQLWSYNGSMYPDWVVGVRELLLLECSPLRAIPEQHGFSAHLLQLSIYSCSWDALPYNMKLLTSLQTLEINECMNIRSLPTLPQSLLHFFLSNCDRQFMRSCETVGHPNWEKIQHVRMINISPRTEPTGSFHDSNSSEDDYEELC